jgi:hypothetical protein
MTDPHPLAFMRLPFDLLAALDSRAFHYALQRFHHLVRLSHILAMAGFFGAVAMLDLRLLGYGRVLPFRPVAEQILPWLYWSFGITIGTGLMLFFYDPVHVGSHGYFVPKLLLIVLASLLVLAYRRTQFGLAFTETQTMPLSARVAGGLSLALWTGVIVCSCLNVEAAPKVILR